MSYSSQSIDAGSVGFGLWSSIYQVIANEKEYKSRKENYLEKLKEQLRNQNLSRESRYSIYQSLAGEYETFICDSAIVYANRALYEAA